MVRALDYTDQAALAVIVVDIRGVIGNRDGTFGTEGIAGPTVVAEVIIDDRPHGSP
jgi:hypothetical protein